MRGTLFVSSHSALRLDPLAGTTLPSSEGHPLCLLFICTLRRKRIPGGQAGRTELNVIVNAKSTSTNSLRGRSKCKPGSHRGCVLFSYPRLLYICAKSMIIYSYSYM